MIPSSTLAPVAALVARANHLEHAASHETVERSADRLDLGAHLVSHHPPFRDAESRIRGIRALGQIGHQRIHERLIFFVACHWWLADALLFKDWATAHVTEYGEFFASAGSATEETAEHSTRAAVRAA
jgi:hypothetical protein